MKKLSNRTIKKFQEGDKDAFEDIFYYYKDKIYYFAYYYVKDYDDANDCVQEIFIKLVNTIKTFNPDKSSFVTWFYLLGRTVIFNFIRAKRRYQERVIYDESIVERYGEEDFTELQHTLYDLEDIMGTKMYAVYILRTGYKLSFEQIQFWTDINRETARRLYEKSLTIVKEYLGDEYNEEKI